jgi:hypothetical protein
MNFYSYGDMDQDETVGLYFRTGGIVHAETASTLYSILTDYWRKRLLTRQLIHYFLKWLWLYPEKLVNHIAQFLLPPEDTYYLPDFKPFWRKGGDYVTQRRVLDLIDRAWNPKDYRSWMEAPKNDELVVQILIDLYYFHMRKNTSPLVHIFKRQKVGWRVADEVD